MKHNFHPNFDLRNSSVTSEKISNSHKVAKYKQLYKQSLKPASLLPIISKVNEKVIHNQLSTFLNLKNVWYTYQRSFQKKKTFYRFLPLLE